MDKQDLKRIIIEQSEEVEHLFRSERIVRRELDIEQALRHPNAVVIMGPRRAGKSTLALSVVKERKPGYLNFDDERLSLTGPDLNLVLETLCEIHGELDTFVLDEIQNIPGWELFVGRLRRTKRVIVTGSNARLLAGELASRLTGRHLDFTLLPFSFREFLDRRGGPPPAAILTTAQEAALRRDLDAYRRDGGFPEVFKFGRAILKTLYEDILHKDIILRFKLRKSVAFREIARLLSAQYSREFSYSRLKAAVQIKDVHTVKKFVDYLLAGYLFFSVERFSFKLKQQLISPRKIYGIDPGLVAATAFRISEDQGHLDENLVAVELLRRKAYWGEGDIYYWRDPCGAEVDFCIKTGPRITELIQVCRSFAEMGKKERELGALIKASEELRCRRLLVLTDDLEGEDTFKKAKVQLLPLWKWLLQAPGGAYAARRDTAGRK